MTRIPAMHRVLADERIVSFETALGRNVVKRAAEEVFGRARASGDASYDDVIADLARRLEEVRRASLLPVINATGVILHTNLGRAPLAAAALDAIVALGGGYSNLEYDLATGSRGSRYARVAEALNDVTGAEDSLVVNNCAAALLLALDTFAKGRDVIAARNSAVEIGGGFRIPDVLARSGATLVEVGTTNRIYIEDFERALSPRTALLLRTHPSNYRIDGFTHDVEPRALAQLGRRAGVPVLEDLGSGALVALEEFGAAHERTVQEAVSDGVGLVAFSGDKLLGGPQAGIVVGAAPLIARMRNNPLLRALRVGKTTIAALDATLQCYRDGSLRQRLPVYRMLGATLDELHARAEAFVEAIARAKIVESTAYAGGGSLAQAAIPSVAVAVAVANPDRCAARLREHAPPIVGRIDDGRILFDLRTIAPNEDAVVIRALAALSASE